MIVGWFVWFSIYGTHPSNIPKLISAMQILHSAKIDPENWAQSLFPAPENANNAFLYFCKHKRISVTWPKFAKNSLQSGHCSILWMRRTTVSAKAWSCPILSYLPNLGFKLKAASFQLSSVSPHTISFFGIFNVSTELTSQPAFISDPAESDKIGTLCRSHNLDLMWR